MLPESFHPLLSNFSSHLQIPSDILDASHLIEHLRDERYDVALAEAWDPCSFGLFHAINIPTTLGTMAIPLDNNLAKTLGIPHPPSFNPILCAASINGDTMPYLERAWNFFLRTYNSWVLAPRVHKVINGVFRDKFGPSFPGIERIAENMSLAFVNANEFFDLSKPISHKVINIGGIVEKKPKALTTDMEEIFSESKNGVVLFSFGSIADTTKMTEEMKQAFLNAFSRFPDVTFVWKLQVSGNDSHLLDRHSNVHVVDWVDQVSILAHPKTRAFITHCGLNSLNEASSHGVPLLAIPLFGDQLYNAAIVLKKKMGVYMDIREITEDSVHQALDKVLNDPSYREHAQLVKNKLERAPFKAAEKFVKWTEFAAEFSDLSELGLAGAGMNFFVYHSLDVIIPLLLAVVLLIVVGYLAVSVVVRRIWSFWALKKKLE
ncbi:Protein UGT-54 [Aphelenchoides avenae]|nr:Protein UGT-54 [Aphelenchus avenae]